MKPARNKKFLKKQKMRIDQMYRRFTLFSMGKPGSIDRMKVLPPSGFRDFLPDEAATRVAMMESISKIYRSHGFQPIGMSILENLSTLQGKGGGTDNEKLIFKVLKRGDQLEAGFREVKLADEGKSNFDSLSDMGLRFDLTLPLARYCARFKEQLPKPFKVFQMGPVWRADRPQKGRFREFFQCDVDIVGSKEIGAEIDCISAILEVFAHFEIEGIELHLNDRRLLQSAGEKLGVETSKWSSFLVCLDKLDKIGVDGVKKESADILTASQLSAIEPLIQGGKAAEDFFAEINPEAYSSVKKIISILSQRNKKSETIHFTTNLVRGQDYYTGTIFEIRHAKLSGSLGGGGRYNRLLEVFGSPDTPAFGGSIGFERLALILSEEGKLKNSDSTPHVFFPLFSEELRGAVFKIAEEIRQVGLRADVFPDAAKLKNQFRYADDRKIPFVALLGDEELKAGQIKLKTMATREEKSISLKEFPQILEKLCKQ